MVGVINMICKRDIKDKSTLSRELYQAFNIRNISHNLLKLLKPNRFSKQLLSTTRDGTSLYFGI